MKSQNNQTNNLNKLQPKEMEWASESFYYSAAKIPTVVSAFEDAKVELCKHGLEKICAVSSGVVSG